MFTQEELKSLSVLLQRAEIKGAEAIPTAFLIQKISRKINEGDSPAKEKETTDNSEEK